MKYGYHRATFDKEYQTMVFEEQIDIGKESLKEITVKYSFWTFAFILCVVIPISMYFSS